MSFWDVVDKSKIISANSNNTDAGNAKKKKKQSSGFWNVVDRNKIITVEDVAPAKASGSVAQDNGSKPDLLGLDFVQKGSFADGFDWYDIPSAILGTAGDAVLEAAKGLGGVSEGIADLILYGVAGVADAFGEKHYADEWRKGAQENTIDKWTKGADDFLEQYSLMGDASDAILQGVGQVAAIAATGGLGQAAGLGELGVTALTTGAMGLSGMGSGISEAYQGGATDGEAVAYGLISGAADAVSELIFGGLGKGINALGFSKGLSSADDMLAKKVSSLFKSQIAKNFAEFGIKAGAEGVEEVLSGIAQAVGKKMTYMSEEDIRKIFEDENLLEQFVVGAVTSGIMQSPSLVVANKTKTDFITGHTKNEQAVIKAETAKRIEQRESGGAKLTNKEKSSIQTQVENDLGKGYIPIDTITEVLGGEDFKAYQDAVAKEDALQKEFNTLNKMKQGEMTGEQIDRRNELKQELQKAANRESLKAKAEETALSIAKNDRLAESFNERTRRGQAFKADLSKYNEKQRAIVKRAIDSGILNNTNRTHEFVDFIARICGDKGCSFDFINNEGLKDSGFALNGKQVNAYVVTDSNGKRITLNIESAKALNSVVGHEIAHVVEGTELEGALREAIIQYAKVKGEYQSRYDGILELYKGVYAETDGDFNEKITRELVADLVGDYLFTDADFVKSLSVQHRNVFQKIYDEIKYLCKVATAGSKEARALEKVKKVFAEVYRESGAVSETGTGEAQTRYSISETTDGRLVAVVDNDILSHIDTTSWDNTKKDEAKKAASDALKQFCDGGLKHPRKDSFVDFDRGTTLICAGRNKYTATVLVGITNTSDAVFMMWSV